jgi:hypothetical protein
MIKRTAIQVVVTVLLACAASAQTPSNPLGNEPAKFDEKLESAMLHKDVAFLQSALADDVRFTHGTGPNGTHNVWDKARWLEMTPKSPATERNLDSVEVEPHGDVIETTGHTQVKTSNAANPEYHIWYVRVYAKRDGRWQLLSNRTVRQANGPMPAK